MRGGFVSHSNILSAAEIYTTRCQDPSTSPDQKVNLDQEVLSEPGLSARQRHFFCCESETDIKGLEVEERSLEKLKDPWQPSHFSLLSSS